MFPDGLTMLWESDEPGVALRERFGFADLDATTVWLMSTLATNWAIAVSACDRVLISGSNAIAWVQTDRGAQVVKWSCAPRLFDRLEAVADLLQGLAEQDQPVARPARTIAGRHRHVSPGASVPLSVVVQPVMPGTLMDVDDAAAVRAAGAALARLHTALSGRTDPRLTDPHPAPVVDLRNRILSWLATADHGRNRAASARLRDQVTALPALDHLQQLTHRDYRSTNVLTTGDRVSAILDFDEITWGSTLDDLAHAATHLTTRFTDWRPTRSAVRTQLIDGYASVRALTELDHDWLSALIRWSGLRSIPPGDDPDDWAGAV